MLFHFFQYVFPIYLAHIFQILIKSILKVFIVLNCFLIVIFGVIFCNCSVFSVFIGNTVVFSKFIVVPDAFLRFWKKVRTLLTDSWFFKKKLESSAYWDNFTWFFWFGICIPITFLFLLILLVVTWPCIT